MLRFLFGSLGASLIGIGLASCGPSLRGAQQSTIYYERCYVADLDPTIQPQQKEACWTAWLHHYANGQPPHRVTYAQHREVALAEGDTLAPMAGMPVELWNVEQSATFLSGISDFHGVLPAREDAERSVIARAPPGNRMAPCSGFCGERWDTCIARCRGDSPDSCVEACSAEYRVCVGSCP